MADGFTLEIDENLARDIERPAVEAGMSREHYARMMLTDVAFGVEDINEAEWNTPGIPWDARQGLDRIVGNPQRGTQNAMKLVVSPRAANDIEDLRSGVMAHPPPRAGSDFTTAIERSFALLLEFPLSAPTFGRKRRQRFTDFGRDGLILHYAIRAQDILILRVLHGRLDR